MQQIDPRLTDAKLKSIEAIAARLNIEGLKRVARELVGPCPVCGGKDRFSINKDMGVYNCRTCGGGDVIRLVELVQGCDFKEALQWLCGDAEVKIDPEEAKRREARFKKEQQRRDGESDRYRQYARKRAYDNWTSALPAKGTIVEEYLRLRGLPLADIPACIRFHPDLPYVKKIGGKNTRLHSGPAMVAAIQLPDGRFSALHQTWLDVSQPKGKALIFDPEGAQISAKLYAGPKKTCAIRLHTPEGASTLVMGEGIETTASAWVADVIPNAAYWAGVDLGNMAGRQVKEKGKRHSGVPDLVSGADGFVPPPWVKRLIYVMDGDSNPKDTRAKLLAGCRRAIARCPGLVASIVSAETGRDLNDMIMGEPDNG
ncbi:MAG: hypothetical protein COB08_005550 [Rhodobacteraceae bacterium]|nr:hypothetical protein [Paracoccaceae bacterium]